MNKDEKEWFNKISMLGYAGVLGNEFEFKLHKLSKLIGYAHHVSVGDYKERLLREEISKFLPSKYKVGTGFILYPNIETLYGDAEQKVSSQIDILIYNDFEYSPLFRDKDFVILKPESVEVIIEVKGNLSSTDFNETIEKFENISEEWDKTYKTYENVRIWGEIKLKNPLQILFAWNRNPTEKGNEVTFENASRKMCDVYKKLHSKYKYDRIEVRVPYVNSFYCYKDYSVHMNLRSKNSINPSYKVMNGKYIENKVYFDRTIFDLISQILCKLRCDNMLYDIMRLEGYSDLTIHNEEIEL